MGCIYGFAVERVLVWFYSLFDEMESLVKSAMFFFVAPVLDMSNEHCNIFHILAHIYDFLFYRCEIRGKMSSFQNPYVDVYAICCAVSR